VLIKGLMVVKKLGVVINNIAMLPSLFLTTKECSAQKPQL
jgi:hypothetical protein